jgi:hypothetical protein
VKSWQTEMLAKLVAYFQARAEVVGLLLFGSGCNPDFPPDDWSDLDVLVVVKDGGHEQFFPMVEWLAAFGKLYTYSQSADDYKYTTRACFDDFSRIDFVITTEGQLVDIRKWPTIPFQTGIKILFSRSNLVDEISAQAYPPQELPPVTQDQFLELVRNFRFKSMLAVYKVVRNDLLIALHLTQDLVRDCSVLGMLLRDRATGTNIHKHGGVGNQLVAQLEITQKPFTPVGVLESIQASNEIFDKLAREWSSSYQENRQPLLAWIEKAKAELHG